MTNEAVSAGTYERGAELGCPDCIAGEMHCCPFLWADAQEKTKRRWALDHMRYHLADDIESLGTKDG